MIDVRSLVRPHLLQLEPYAAARHDADSDGLLRLDANENGWRPSDAWDTSRYPDPLQRRLKSVWGEMKGVDPARVFVGNGSDECIDLLIRAFCRPGRDRVLVTPPTYGMYATAATINGVSVTEVPLGARFELDPGAILDEIDPDTRLIVLCSPNNPTGNLLGVSALESILRAARGLVVIDEAYVDFSDTPSWMARLDEFDNLVVLQTLSKAWGLAGIRVGMACAGEPVIDVLNRIKPPYNVSGPSQSMAMEALLRADDLEASIKAIVEERERLAARLRQRPGVVEVFPSATNFLLVRVLEATQAYEALRSRGIVVRDRSNLPGCEDCLRITVGRPEENDRLLTAMSQLGGQG
jgi:histidinol-phosphate aminotransferase